MIAGKHDTHLVGNTSIVDKDVQTSILSLEESGKLGDALFRRNVQLMEVNFQTFLL